MKINQNMSAVRTNKQLLRTENKLAASMERLSSGYKINHAGDNPAGLAISHKMKAQIDALDQAETNASNGVSVLQIADGALNEVSSILQRMRELAVQAANGTNTTEDKTAIQSEIDALEEEVDRISTDTEYNTKALLDGSSDVRVYASNGNATRIDLSDHVPSGTYTVQINAAATQAETTMNMGTIDDTVIGASGTIHVNGVGVEITEDMTKTEVYEQIRNAAEVADCDVEVEGSNITLKSTLYGTKGTIKITTNSQELGAALGMPVSSDDYDAETRLYTMEDARGTNAQVSRAAESGLSDTSSISAEGNRITITDQNGFSIDFLAKEGAQGYPAGTVELEVTEIGTMTIQIGANEFQTMEVRIPEVSAESLYLDTLDVTTATGPDRAIETMDDAIARVSEIRSRIGASQNRLEYASSSLAESQEDMTAAYSNLMDTDMATEMTEYTQQNVLDQASISVLAQANDLPQQILSLLS